MRKNLKMANKIYYETIKVSSYKDLMIYVEKTHPNVNEHFTKAINFFSLENVYKNNKDKSLLRKQRKHYGAKNWIISYDHKICPTVISAMKLFIKDDFRTECCKASDEQKRKEIYKKSHELRLILTLVLSYSLSLNQ